MTDQSLVTLFNKIIQDNHIHNKINTLIFSIDPKTNFNKIRKVVFDNNKKIIKADILTNNYFQKKLSLFQNIKFNAIVNNTADIETFFNKVSVNEAFEKSKNYCFNEIDHHVWLQFEVLTYIYANKDLFIEKNNFFSVINTIPCDVSLLLKDKNIFFLTSNAIQHLKQISQFFDVFMHLSHNELNVYGNFETFSDEITSCQKL